jgi:hypothetical protein
MAGSYFYDQPADHGCLQRILSNFRSASSMMIVRKARLDDRTHRHSLM